MRAEAAARRSYAGRPARLADLLLDLLPVIDGLAGHEPGHAMRTCYVAMRLAEAMGIADRDRGALFYAALLHDAGSIADGESSGGRPAMMRRLMPISRGTDEEQRAAEHQRVRRGAQFAARAGFGPEVAVTTLALNERWDGRGQPMGLAGEAIPLFARIVALAECVDLTANDEGGPAVLATLHGRSGTWYDPEIASVLVTLCANGLLRDLKVEEMRSAVPALEPTWLMRMVDEEDAERIQGALSLAGSG